MTARPALPGGLDARRATLAAVILGTSIVFLDSTVVNVALPKIGQELRSGLVGVLEGQSYVYNGYLLTLSALLILGGALADVYGRRRMFAIGLVAFGTSSILCGLAPNLEALILFRIVQGSAGALLVPGSLAILTSTFSGVELGRAFGLWAGASAATSILGPFVGGVLVQLVSWRAAFLINVPLVLIALWLTWTAVAESRDPDAERAFDWGGAALVAVALAGLSFGAIYGQQHEWAGWTAQASIAVGILAAIGFLILMARGRHPLVPLGLFRSRNFAVANLSTLLIYGALYVSAYTQGLFVQGTLGYTASAAGVIGLPGSLMLALFSSRVGGLAARIGFRRFMAVGPAIMAAGVLWLARVPADSPPWKLLPNDPATWIPSSGYLVDFLPGMLLFGCGVSLMVAPLTSAVMTSVSSSRAGLASAINNAISRVGPQLAGAIVFVAITAAFYAGMASRLPGVDTGSGSFRSEVAPLNLVGIPGGSRTVDAARLASADAFHLAMVIAAAFLLLGAIVNAIGIRDPERSEAAASAPEQATAPGA